MDWPPAHLLDHNQGNSVRPEEILFNIERTTKMTKKMRLPPIEDVVLTVVQPKDPHVRIELSKLQVAERYSWYILNALMFKVAQLEKAIKEANESVKPDTPRMLKTQMEHMIAYCEQSLKEHTEALEALKAAGFK
jgi:hypothetical protein